MGKLTDKMEHPDPPTTDEQKISGIVACILEMSGVGGMAPNRREKLYKEICSNLQQLPDEHSKHLLATINKVLTA